MIEIIEHLHCIYNNPFIFSPLILKFYQNYKSQRKDILLSYLILPLVLHEDTKNKLKNVNSTSSIQTFRSNKEVFFGLPERVNSYRNMTNKCLQYAIDNRLCIIDDLSVKLINPKLKINCEPELNDSFKASGNLVKVFKNLEVPAIYRLLGVKEL